MAVARGVDEVDAVESSRIAGAGVALACVALIHHVFDLRMGSALLPLKRIRHLTSYLKPGCDFVNCFLWRSSFISLGDIILASIGLCHLPESDQVLMSGRLIRCLRFIWLKIKSEFQVVGEELFRLFLVGIQEDGLVGTAMQSSLICLNRASRILLLK